MSGNFNELSRFCHIKQALNKTVGHLQSSRCTKSCSNDRILSTISKIKSDHLLFLLGKVSSRLIYFLFKLLWNHVHSWLTVAATTPHLLCVTKLMLRLLFFITLKLLRQCFFSDRRVWLPSEFSVFLFEIHNKVENPSKSLKKLNLWISKICQISRINLSGWWFKLCKIAIFPFDFMSNFFCQSSNLWFNWKVNFFPPHYIFQIQIFGQFEVVDHHFSMCHVKI